MEEVPEGYDWRKDPDVQIKVASIFENARKKGRIRECCSPFFEDFKYVIFQTEDVSGLPEELWSDDDGRPMAFIAAKYLGHSDSKYLGSHVIPDLEKSLVFVPEETPERLRDMDALHMLLSCSLGSKRARPVLLEHASRRGEDFARRYEAHFLGYLRPMNRYDRRYQ